MARPRFLSRNNDNAPAAKRKADDDNVAKRKGDDNDAPKHVSAAHKAQALQDLLDDDSNARPHVGYLQFLGILPTNFIAKTEVAATPSWAGSTTSSDDSSSSISFAPQASNPAFSFLAFLGVSAVTVRAVEAQHVAIIAEQVAIQAQAAVEEAIASNVSPTELAEIISTATQAQVAATDAQVVAEVVAEEVTTAIVEAVDTANADAEKAAADLVTANAARDEATRANAEQQAALAAAASWAALAAAAVASRSAAACAAAACSAATTGLKQSGRSGGYAASPWQIAALAVVTGSWEKGSESTTVAMTARYLRFTDSTIHDCLFNIYL